MKQWNLLRCNTPSCWSANTQSLLHTWNTLWWLQIQRTFTSCVQFLALPLCVFGHESCVDLSFALDHLTVCSVTDDAPCVVNFQRWLFVSVDWAIIKCVFFDCIQMLQYSFTDQISTHIMMFGCRDHRCLTWIITIFSHCIQSVPYDEAVFIVNVIVSLMTW